MTAPTPLALLVAVPFLASQALGAVVAVPVPVAGLPFYTVMSPDLLQSFGVGGDSATTAPATPEEAQPEAVPPTPDAATAGDGPALEYAPQVPDLNEAWLNSFEQQRLRASLLRQKRTEYGYPPEGPAGSELLPEDVIPYPDRGAAELSPLAPQADDGPAWRRRMPRSGNGWRYRHHRGSEDAALPEDTRGRGYLRRYRPPTERDPAAGSIGPRALPHGESMEYNGPWPWELEEGAEQTPDDTETMQLRMRPIAPGTQVVLCGGTVR